MFTTVIDMIQNNAKVNSEKIALISDKKSISYGDLNKKINNIAEYLTNEGVTNGDIIPIIMDSSIEMLLVILGVMKCGAAFLPIDTENPNERIDFILKQSNPKKIIINNLEKMSLRQEFLDIMINLTEIFSYQACKNKEYIYSKNDIAYVIFTSGTTGTPKGVKINQYSFAKTMNISKDMYKVNHNSKVISLFPFYFDGFIQGVFTTLIMGATLIIPEKNQIKDPIKIKDLVLNQQVDFIAAVPTMISLLLDYLSKADMTKVNVVALGGERVSKNLFNKIKNYNINTLIINLYGPTEASVFVAYKYLYDEFSEDLDTQVVGSKIYILDDNMNEVQEGEIGGVYIESDRLSSGYLNDNSLTDEKFVKVDFSNNLLFKTGDLAKKLSNDKFEIKGRLDNQVKINGLRIELDDIEKNLEEIESINKAVVKVEDINNVKALIAYYESENELDTNLIISQLKKKLIDYMVPKVYRKVEKFNLTHNGKIDRDNIPVYKIGVTNCETKPFDKTQQLFIDTVKEFTGAKSVSIDDNIFELGVDSVKIIQIVSRFTELGFNLDPVEVFANPIIKDICKIIDNGDIPQDNKIEFQNDSNSKVNKRKKLMKNK